MQTTPSHSYIIFGTGPLGLAVMDALHQQGQTRIILVNRRGQVGESLPPGVTVTAGDATNADNVAQLCAEADVVFHCAQPAYHQWPEKFPPLTTAILNGVSRSQARLVFGDNLYMYGPTGGQPIHEGLPYAATGHKGRTRADMARQLLEAHQAGRVQVTIGRGSDFYGPRVRSSALGEMFFPAALAGKAANVLGNPDLPHTYTYIRDFARGLVTLSAQESAYGQAWHVPNAPTVSTRQFADLVGTAVGKPVKLRPAGKLILKIGGLFVPEMREMQEMFYEFAAPYVVDHRHFEAAFGSVVTAHETAIAETVAWFRQQE